MPEGLRIISVDHWAEIEKKERDLLASKEGKSVDKAFITSVFNNLNSLS